MRLFCFFGMHNWTPKFSECMGYYTSVTQPSRQVCSRCHQIRLFDMGHEVEDSRADPEKVKSALDWLICDGWDVNQVHNYCWDAVKGNATYRLSDKSTIRLVELIQSERKPPNPS